MMERLRTIGMAVCGFALITNVAWAADSLTGSEIETEIIGHDLEIRRMGMTATLRYDEDGSAEAKMPVGGRSGTWEIEGDELCVTWNDADRECVTFDKTEKDGVFIVQPRGTEVTRVS